MLETFLFSSYSILPYLAQCHDLGTRRKRTFFYLFVEEHGKKVDIKVVLNCFVTIKRIIEVCIKKSLITFTYHDFEFLKDLKNFKYLSKGQKLRKSFVSLPLILTINKNKSKQAFKLLNTLNTTLIKSTFTVNVSDF